MASLAQAPAAARPAAEEYVTAVSKEQLEKLKHVFHPAAEIIPEFMNRFTDSFYINQEKIYSLIQRRPCTIEQIMAVYNIHMNEATKYLEKLIAANKILSVRMNNNAYFMAVR